MSHKHETFKNRNSPTRKYCGCTATKVKFQLRGFVRSSRWIIAQGKDSGGMRRCCSSLLWGWCKRWTPCDWTSSLALAALTFLSDCRSSNTSHLSIYLVILGLLIDWQACSLLTVVCRCFPAMSQALNYNSQPPRNPLFHRALPRWPLRT